MRLILKKTIDEHDRVVAEEALNALADMKRLPAEIGWRIMQLEAMLCEKQDAKEMEEP